MCCFLSLLRWWLNWSWRLWIDSIVIYHFFPSSSMGGWSIRFYFNDLFLNSYEIYRGSSKGGGSIRIFYSCLFKIDGESAAGGCVHLSCITSSFVYLSISRISPSSVSRESNWLLVEAPLFFVGCSWVFSCHFPGLLLAWVGFNFFPLLVCFHPSLLFFSASSLIYLGKLFTKCPYSWNFLHLNGSCS